jgi:hypothetical protein
MQMQAMRAARMHSEERALEVLSEEGNTLIEEAPPSASLTNVFPVAVRSDRMQMQAMRAARMHSEERELEALSEEGQATDHTTTIDEDASAVYIIDSVIPVLNQTDSTIWQAPSRASRRAFQAVRAKRMADEEECLHQAAGEVALAEAIAGPNPWTAGTSSAQGNQKIKFQRMRAARMAEEEQACEDSAAATALAEAIAGPNPWTAGTSSTQDNQKIKFQRMRAARMAEEEQECEDAAAAAALAAAIDGPSPWAAIPKVAANAPMQAMRAERMDDPARELYLEACKTAIGSPASAKSLRRFNWL